MIRNVRKFTHFHLVGALAVLGGCSEALDGETRGPARIAADLAAEPMVLDVDAADLLRYQEEDRAALREVLGATRLVGLPGTLGEHVAAVLEAADGGPDTFREPLLAELKSRLLAIRLRSGEEVSQVLGEDAIQETRLVRRRYAQGSDGWLVEASPPVLARCNTRDCTPRPDACLDASDWEHRVNHDLSTEIFLGYWMDVSVWVYSYDLCNEDIEARTRPHYVNNLEVKVGPDVSAHHDDGICQYDTNDFDYAYRARSSQIEAGITGINLDTGSELSGGGVSDLAFDGYQHRICED